MAPGANVSSFTSSQWPTGPVDRSRTSGPPIVLIAMSMRPSLSASAAASPRPFSVSPSAERGDRAAEPLGALLPGRPASTRTGSASFFRLVTGIAPAASTRSSLPLFARSTHESPQPAKLGAERRDERGPRARERRRVRPSERRT